MERFVSASFAPLVIAMAITLSLGCVEDTSSNPEYSGVEVKKEPGALPKCGKEDEPPIVYYVMSTDEFVYCNGVEYVVLADLAWPEDGISWIVEAIPAAPGSCPAGGATINAGPDANRDGIMDEVTSTETVCNGVDGVDGTDGQDGISWVVETETILTSGVPPCPGGGIIINVGPDTNADGLIDGEPTSVETICHGIGWIVETETLPPSGGPPCPTGGVAISAGPDANRDGQIDDEPPPFSDTVCSGSGCTVADNENGTYNITCGDSTVTVSDPACTVDDNGDGTATIRCNDGTYTTVLDVQECGDGIVHYGEECDDGNLQERDGCSPICVIEYSDCGDGIVEWDEECDDGGESATCNSDCTPAVCGDLTVNTTAGEECDDEGESATCDSDCTLAVCGDLTVNTTAGEECDDGGSVGGDGCAADCTYELVCGDGFVVPNHEECDDGNNVSGDGCSADCLYEFLLAYSSWNADELFTNIPSGAEQQLIAAHRWSSSAWNSDGSRIGYLRDGMLYTNAPDGSDETRVSEDVAAEVWYVWSWSPDARHVMFLADRYQPNQDLYVGAVDGSASVKVSDTGGALMRSWVWSPDGTRVAYVADQGPDGTSELYVSTRDGLASHKVSVTLGTGGVITEIAFSPDGQRIAYEARLDDSVAAKYQLFTNAWNGGDSYQVNGPLTDDESVDEWVWSPQSDRLAYIIDLWVLGAPASNMRTLYTNAWNGQDEQSVDAPVEGDLAWSPDGSRIGYLRVGYSATPPSGDCSYVSRYINDADCDCPPNGSLDCDPQCSVSNEGGRYCGCEYCWGPDPIVDELYTNTPDGSDPLRLNAGIVGSDGVWKWAWSPDGTRIAYRADQDTHNIDELYTSAWNGSDNFKLNGPFVEDGDVSDFSWSPDGSRVAFRADAETEYTYELYCSRWNGTEKSKVNGPLVSGGEVSEFAWSPDGWLIAYIADQDAANDDELYTSAPNGSDNQKVSDLPDDQVAEFAWSPAPNR